MTLSHHPACFAGTPPQAGGELITGLSSCRLVGRQAHLYRAFAGAPNLQRWARQRMAITSMNARPIAQ
jgi:hypothetical protein